MLQSTIFGKDWRQKSQTEVENTCFLTRPQILDRSRWMRFGAWPLLCSSVRLGLNYRIEPFATSVELLAEEACKVNNADIFVGGFKDVTHFFPLACLGFQF